MEQWNFQATSLRKNSYLVALQGRLVEALRVVRLHLLDLDVRSGGSTGGVGEVRVVRVGHVVG